MFLILIFSFSNSSCIVSDFSSSLVILKLSKISLLDLLDFTRIKEAKKNLPSKSKYYAIEGGNSTNFADIELVSGDEEAIISPLTDYSNMF